MPSKTQARQGGTPSFLSTRPSKKRRETHAPWSHPQGNLITKQMSETETETRKQRTEWPWPEGRREGVREGKKGKRHRNVNGGGSGARPRGERLREGVVGAIGKTRDDCK